jgi:hypothetical protein
LTIWAKNREISNVDEVHTLTRKIIWYMGTYFKKKHQVDLDLINAKVNNLDLATQDKNSESMRGKGEKFTLDLNKSCEKILVNDKDKPAKAWIDGTPYKFSAETNDLEWKREYLSMPLKVASMSENLHLMAEYNENLKLHLEVQKEQLKTQKETREIFNELKELIKNNKL